MGKSVGHFFRFQKGGDKKNNKTGMRVIRNFKMANTVILGAKTKKFALLTICVTIVVLFSIQDKI